MKFGSFIDTPARRRRRGEWTDPQQLTVLLAVHYASPKASKLPGLLPKEVSNKMGVSIYYSARRSRALSDSEQRAIDELVSRYSVKDQIDKYLRTGSGWRGEDFCLYDPPLDSEDTILEGATGLPGDSDSSLWEAAQHWCRALSELRRLLVDAEWHVHIDDYDVHWDEERQIFDPFQ